MKNKTSPIISIKHNCPRHSCMLPVDFQDYNCELFSTSFRFLRFSAEYRNLLVLALHYVKDKTRIFLQWDAGIAKIANRHDVFNRRTHKFKLEDPLVGIPIFRACNGCIFVVLLLSLLLFQCTKSDSADNTAKIVDSQPKLLSTTDNGMLEITGEGEDQIHVLTVWGSSYEMGKAHGTLLKEQIKDHVNNMVKLMVEKSGQPVEAMDHVFAETKPFIPQHFLDEMQGLADGSGMPLQEIIRANLIGEAGEWHCSLFGAWGKATAADGHLYQLRSLDYETGANIQKYPLIVVYHPEEGIPFANITWAGVVGCISGISREQLAISEIGDDYHKESDTFAGIPFMFLLRDILQFDTSLDEAIDRVCSANRTTSLMYGIGDGELGELRGLQTSHIACNVFAPQNLEPLTDAHQRIDDVVYWGMSWDVPNYDGPLHDKLVEHYGSINAEVTIKDILPFVRTGNLQTVVYDLTDMAIWVANARADHESGPLDAFDRQYVKFQMNKLFAAADSLAKH